MWMRTKKAFHGFRQWDKMAPRKTWWCDHLFLSAATQQRQLHTPSGLSKCPRELERVLGSSQPITSSWIPQIQNITPGGSITQVPLEFWINIHQPVWDSAFRSTHNILLSHVLSCGNSFSVSKQTSLFLWLPTLPLWRYNKSFISFLINAHFLWLYMLHALGFVSLNTFSHSPWDVFWNAEWGVKQEWSDVGRGFSRTLAPIMLSLLPPCVFSCWTAHLGDD